MTKNTEATTSKKEPMKYAKITDRITILNLPPDKSADVVLLFRYSEVILQIGNEHWTWPRHKWVEGVDPADH
jgi:hypothetical protein